MSYPIEFTNQVNTFDSFKFHVTYENDKKSIGDPIIDDIHLHNSYEIYIYISGNVSFLYNNEVLSLEPWDILLIRPGEIHHCIYHSDCVHEHFCIWIDFSEASPLSEFINKNELSGLLRLNNKYHGKLSEISHKLFKNQTDKESLNNLIEFMKLFDILREKKDTPAIANNNIPTVMQNILKYTDDNFRNINHVKEIAEHFYISVPTLNRMFRVYLHLSPYALIQNKKLSYSEGLLRQGLSVTDACYQSGFGDCSRYIKFFKSRYGKTPLQYKKTWECCI